ncbi:MAG: TIGR02266 family protein [Archangiaceae bacterium]|nr:TIGR02266 family protein [Archangiaceae bacterium]
MRFFDVLSLFVRTVTEATTLPRQMSDDEQGGGAERRRHPRTPLSLLVQYRFNSFDDFLAEYSLNISPGGIFIRTDTPLEEGSMVYLQFSLKDGSRLIEGMGKVVRKNPPGVKDRVAGMGIEFVNFDDESMALINEICAQREATRSRS